MHGPDELERAHSLATATRRYDDLRMRDALAAMHPDPGGSALTRAEILEMLALSEIIIRKAGYGRQATVRSARAAGASWTEIGVALGISKQSAWEAHRRWAEEPAGQAPDPDR